MNERAEVWATDDGTRPVRPGDQRPCRMPKCQRPAAIELARTGRRGKNYWWAYCDQHTYGRVIYKGRCWIRVPADSPFAARAEFTLSLSVLEPQP